jgi:hypothetical protein
MAERSTSAVSPVIEPKPNAHLLYRVADYDYVARILCTTKQGGQVREFDNQKIHVWIV